MNARLLSVSAVALAVLPCVFATGTASARERQSAAVACNPCAVDQTLSWHGTAYRVRRVRLANRIGDGFVGGHADGVFVVVTLTMTDLKSRPSTILASNVLLRTRAGDTYDQSDKAFAVYNNGFNILVNLEPHLPKTVIAVYDIPRGATRGAALQINDLFSGAKARIKLGL